MTHIQPETIAHASVKQTENLLGSSAWINRIEAGDTGVQHIESVRNQVFQHLFSFLSRDVVGGYEAQLAALNVCIETVNARSISRFLETYFKKYHDDGFAQFFNCLKVGVDSPTSKKLSPDQAYYYLRKSLYYIFTDSLYPTPIDKIGLSEEDENYNYLALKFEVQRLSLSIHKEFVMSNMAKSLANAQCYSDTIAQAVQGLGSGNAATSEVATQNSRLGERSEVQRSKTP